MMRINAGRVICCLGLSLAPSGWCAAQPSGAASTQPQNEKADPGANELAAIRAGAQSFVEAFNKKDAQAIAALWTEQGEYIDDSGRRYSGREEIEKCYAELFAENEEAKIQVSVDSLRLVGEGVAVEDGRAAVNAAPNDSPTFSHYTAMHVKEVGKWKMASVRDTWIETPLAERNVADLDWLVGTWSAEEHGAKTESVCRWVANGSFVQRRYTTTHVDGTTITGVQLIGWNPLGGHVQSWDFSAGGGHAVGIWTPTEGGWMAEMHGVTSQGAITTSVNVLNRLDDNAYAWQSVQRTAGGVALPDTNEVVLKRMPATK